jgi:hypothetical protein
MIKAVALGSATAFLVRYYLLTEVSSMSFMAVKPALMQRSMAASPSSGEKTSLV